MAQDTRVRKFDPNFAVPKELQFAEYYDDTNNVIMEDDDATGDDDAAIDVEVDDDSDIDEDEDSDELDVPSILSIVSQTVRTGADGRTVVDVVLSIDEVFGATKYELRVTK